MGIISIWFDCYQS